MARTVERSNAIAMALRRALPGEKEALWGLFQVYQRELSAHSGSVPDRYGFYPYSQFDSYWGDPERRPFYIESDGTTAGLLFLRLEGADYLSRPARALLIAELYVTPVFRGTGLAGAVLAEAARLARASGRCLTWSCYQANTRALAFYDRLARQLVGEGGWTAERHPHIDITQRARYVYCLTPIGTIPNGGGEPLWPEANP